MKTLIVLLLSSLTVCGQSIEATVSNQMQVLSEKSFKAGILTGVVYERMQIIPNSNHVSQSEHAHIVAEKAWEDFQEMQAQRHPVVQTVIQPGTPYYVGGNTWTSSGATSNSGPTIAITNSHSTSQGTYQAIVAITNTVAVRWQFQEIRDAMEKYDKETKAAEAFNKTNTNPMIFLPIAIPTTYFNHKLTTNDVELGFRLDGIVVWRIPPEALEKH